MIYHGQRKERERECVCVCQIKEASDRKSLACFAGEGGEERRVWTKSFVRIAFVLSEREGKAGEGKAGGVGKEGSKCLLV